MSNFISNDSLKRIKVALFTCLTLERECLEKILESEKKLKIIGRTSDFQELQRITGSLSPEVIVFCSADYVGYTQEVKNLRLLFPETKLLVITQDDDQNHHLWALQNGAAGIVQKGQNAQTLLRAIRQISQGETWISQKLISYFFNNGTKTGENRRMNKKTDLNSLTERETEVIQTLCEGKSNKEIGEKLFISTDTVRHHLSSIYSKLYVEDRLNLIIYAYRKGLVEDKAIPNNRRQKTIEFTEV